MLLLLKSDARWPESTPKSSFAARAPALTGKPACKLSYPSFAQPGPGEPSAVLVYIKLV